VNVLVRGVFSRKLLVSLLKLSTDNPTGPAGLIVSAYAVILMIYLALFFDVL